MKKVLFGITSLTFGGAERVLVDLANRLCKDYDITILTIYDKGSLIKQLNKKINVISIFNKSFKEYSKLGVLKNSFELLYKIKLPEGYDTYISFLEGPITRLFSKSIKNNEKKIKRIAWIHNDITKVFGKGLKAKIKLLFDKKIYNKYDQINFVSEENRKKFEKYYGKMVKTELIRNYLDYNNVIKKSNEMVVLPFDKKDINLVSVCRLVDQKAIDRFIKIHSEIEKEGIHSKVYIIGDGPNRDKLQKLIEEYGEEDKFFLLGSKENPYPFIRNSDYFCLLSYYEGYGMVLDEAKILGRKIIITDTAARESLENYKDGYILPNSDKGIKEGLTNILKSDISKNEEKENEDKSQLENVKKYYDNIIDKIEKTI